MTSARTGPRSELLWPVLVGIWSLVFAAPHFYWAVGGRAGLGAQAGAADAALAQGWFAAYNLAAGCLAVLGIAVAVALSGSGSSRRVRRWLLAAAIAASVVLLLRGLLGLMLLAVSALQGSFDVQTPAILVAVEPWFVLGGLAYAGLALHQRKRATAGVLSP